MRIRAELARIQKKKKTICCLFLIRWFKFVIIIRCELFCNIALTLLNFAYILITQSIHTRCVKCARCQIFGTFGTPNTKNSLLSDVPNLIKFATYYSILTNLPQDRHMWHLLLLFFYSFFSLISLSVSPSNPNPLLSLTLILSSQTPTLTALPRPRRCRWSLPCRSLSNNGFFFFWLWFDGWVGQWVSLDGDVWVQIVLAGFGSDGGGWVWMG